MAPLSGIKVLELEGLAPAPFCGMVLADFGADVTLIRRPGLEDLQLMISNPLHRGKRIILLDLKAPQQKEELISLMEDSDVLIDPYRPGVMERLGLGPHEVLAKNKRIVYVRLTGYGQTGPLRAVAGHDINYLALSGVLSLFKGDGQKPVPPLNLLADFAGGGLMAAFGTLLALFERQRSGMGQVVDVSMTEGVNYLSTFIFGLYYNGLMDRPVGLNRLDGGAPYYQVYETKDKKFMAVGAIEGKFYLEFLKGLGIDPGQFYEKEDEDSWPRMKEEIARRFKERTRDEWTEVFRGLDACVTPVLDLEEVALLEHHRERNRFVMDRVLQPAPAPILSRSPGRAGPSPTEA